MWPAENVAELALIFACAFLVLIVSLPFVLKQVEFITIYMRRPRFTENSKCYLVIALLDIMLDMPQVLLVMRHQKHRV